MAEIRRLHREDFLPLRDACVKIDDFHATSDIYEVVRDNLADLEGYLHELVRRRPAPTQERVRPSILRRVVNLVSSFRMFADHLDRESKTRLGVESAAQLKAALSREYDASFSYRLCLPTP